jgi:hypothetical protein
MRLAATCAPTPAMRRPRRSWGYRRPPRLTKLLRPTEEKCRPRVFGSRRRLGAWTDLRVAAAEILQQAPPYALLPRVATILRLLRRRSERSVRAEPLPSTSVTRPTPPLRQGRGVVPAEPRSRARKPKSETGPAGSAPRSLARIAPARYLSHAPWPLRQLSAPARRAQHAGECVQPLRAVEDRSALSEVPARAGTGVRRVRAAGRSGRGA